jgi:uncharacterized repeat protein (TIGR03833 family)
MYKTPNGYYYKTNKTGRSIRVAAPSITGGRRSRSKTRAKSKPRTQVTHASVKVGQRVTIAIKPYTGKTSTGTVKRVLTKKKYHSRGHKVMLSSGEVGRIK